MGTKKTVVKKVTKVAKKKAVKRKVVTKPKITKNYLMVVLDQSGSMQSIKTQAISAFNEQIETTKNVANNLDVQVGLVKFDSEVSVLPFQPLSAVQKLNEDSYQPGGGTAMYDGVGDAIASLIMQPDIGNNNVSVLVMVISDGQENASRRFTSQLIGEKIQELQKTNRWTFTYAGANQDLSKIVQQLHIPIGNTTTFAATAAGMTQNNTQRSIGTQALYASYSAGGQSVNNFYNQDAEVTVDNVSK